MSRGRPTRSVIEPPRASQPAGWAGGTSPVLYFVRHGETDWNREPVRCQGWADVALNEAGRRQAREQGLRLRGAGIQAIVSSHLRRARETAELIHHLLGGHAVAAA